MSIWYTLCLLRKVFRRIWTWSLPGLHESVQPCSRVARKWRENEEMRRKWRENEEMERDWLSTFPHSLSISSLFLHFLPLFPFPTSKCITFCCKMLNTALLSRMSQKSQHTRYEEIILGRTCCEEAPQFVPACQVVPMWCPGGTHVVAVSYSSQPKLYPNGIQLVLNWNSGGTQVGPMWYPSCLLYTSPSPRD